MQVTTGLQLRLERTRLRVKQRELAAAADRRYEWVSRLEAKDVVTEAQAALYRAALARLAA